MVTEAALEALARVDFASGVRRRRDAHALGDRLLVEEILR
jgi:hypothetical protein